MNNRAGKKGVDAINRALEAAPRDAVIRDRAVAYLARACESAITTNLASAQMLAERISKLVPSSPHLTVLRVKTRGATTRASHSGKARQRPTCPARRRPAERVARAEVSSGGLSRRSALHPGKDRSRSGAHTARRRTSTRAREGASAGTGARANPGSGRRTQTKRSCGARADSPGRRRAQAQRGHRAGANSGRRG